MGGLIINFIMQLRSIKDMPANDVNKVIYYIFKANLMLFIVIFSKDDKRGDLSLEEINPFER